jgi:hypothetical protein
MGSNRALAAAVLLALIDESVFVLVVAVVKRVRQYQHLQQQR